MRIERRHAVRFGGLVVSLLICGRIAADLDSHDSGRGLSIVSSSGQEVGLYRESHALLIGVSDYTAGWPDLEAVPSEIGRVAAVLEEAGFQVERHLDPDGDHLESLFDDFILRHGFEPDDRLLFFFSGHGYTRQDGAKGYLVPADAPDPRIDERGFLAKALSMSQVMTWARTIESKHALFLFDSCFSGTVFKTRSLPPTPPHISEITSRPVRQFITAGKADEVVPARSVFAPVLADGIAHGLADLDGDGFVTGTELGLYLRMEVPRHVGQTPQFGTIPDYELSRGDFVFPLLHGDGAGRLTSAPPEPVHFLGHLQVNVNRTASVFVDGARRGEARPGEPLALVDLPTGDVAVRVEAPGGAAAQELATIRRGEWTQLAFELPNPTESPSERLPSPPPIIEPGDVGECDRRALAQRWLDLYGAALRGQKAEEVRKLGAPGVSWDVLALGDFEERRSYRAEFVNPAFAFGAGFATLSLERIEHWIDPTTGTPVVNRSPETFRLAFPDCRPMAVP